ncbi:DUF3990 domain-containing protein [Clostridium botulinum]|nr:DUF3990 domain-containing protein [Clostridium botulinum]
MKNTKIVYHGSYMKIEFPDIRKHRFTKDFSWGFYCTEIKKQAEKWASKFNTSVINVYELKDIKSLNIKMFEDYTDEWLEFVVGCRDGNTHKYDVVIGPMADDTIYDYIEAYKHGQMNKQKFFELMKFKYPTNQISFHSIEALDHINFIESYELKNND